MPSDKLPRAKEVWQKLLQCSPPPSLADLRDLVEALGDLPSLQREVVAEFQRRKVSESEPKLADLPAIGTLTALLLANFYLSAEELRHLIRFTGEPEVQRAAAELLLKGEPSYTDLCLLNVKFPDLQEQADELLKTPRMLLLEELLNISCREESPKARRESYLAEQNSQRRGH